MACGSVHWILSWMEKAHGVQPDEAVTPKEAVTSPLLSIHFIQCKVQWLSFKRKVEDGVGWCLNTICGVGAICCNGHSNAGCVRIWVAWSLG